MARFISVAETAKLVRAALKENFPGVKFSVRSDSYAGGASIDVYWTDGPTESAVVAIVNQFRGADFDGMTDSMHYRKNFLNGEEVHFGADFIPTNRYMSRTLVEQVVKKFCSEYEVDASEIKIKGEDHRAHVDAHTLGWNMEQVLNQMLRNFDAYVNPKNTKKKSSAQRAKEQKARERQERERKAWEEKERLRKEQEERERQERRERERQYWEEQERLRKEKESARLRGRVPFASKSEALDYLGRSFNATQEQIKQAFRSKVKAASDGKGGYKGDMDILTKAKERALQ